MFQRTYLIHSRKNKKNDAELFMNSVIDQNAVAAADLTSWTVFIKHTIQQFCWLIHLIWAYLMGLGQQILRSGWYVNFPNAVWINERVRFHIITAFIFTWFHRIYSQNEIHPVCDLMQIVSKPEANQTSWISHLLCKLSIVTDDSIRM